MFKTAKVKGLGLVSIATASLMALPAQAEIDTSFVATMQADIISVVTAIGAALLIVGGVAVAYKYGKAALFG